MRTLHSLSLILLLLPFSLPLTPPLYILPLDLFVNTFTVWGTVSQDWLIIWSLSDGIQNVTKVAFASPLGSHYFASHASNVVIFWHQHDLHRFWSDMHLCGNQWWASSFSPCHTHTHTHTHTECGSTGILDVIGTHLSNTLTASGWLILGHTSVSRVMRRFKKPQKDKHWKWQSPKSRTEKAKFRVIR